MKKWLVSLLCLMSVVLHAQNPNKAFITLLDPARENNAVRSPKHFVSGATCKNCTLTINHEPVYVYPTGAFAHELNMKPGINTFTLSASGTDRSTANKKLTYTYTIPVPDTVKELAIADIKIFPEGNLVCQFNAGH